MDSLTEPYKLISALQSICGVARPMLSGGLNCTYEQGKNHVIPLLFAILPGIDPNDMRKSIISLQLVCTFSNMIPIVDCSSASSHHSDLTPVSLKNTSRNVEITFVFDLLIFYRKKKNWPVLHPNSRNSFYNSSIVYFHLLRV